MKCSSRIVFDYLAESEGEIHCEREADHAGAHMASEVAFMRERLGNYERKDLTALTSLVWWEETHRD